ILLAPKALVLAPSLVWRVACWSIYPMTLVCGYHNVLKMRLNVRHYGCVFKRYWPRMKKVASLFEPRAIEQRKKSLPLIKPILKIFGQIFNIAHARKAHPRFYIKT